MSEDLTGATPQTLTQIMPLCSMAVHRLFTKPAQTDNPACRIPVGDRAR